MSQSNNTTAEQLAELIETTYVSTNNFRRSNQRSCRLQLRIRMYSISTGGYVILHVILVNEAPTFIIRSSASLRVPHYDRPRSGPRMEPKNPIFIAVYAPCVHARCNDPVSYFLGDCSRTDLQGTSALYPTIFVHRLHFHRLI